MKHAAMILIVTLLLNSSASPFVLAQDGKLPILAQDGNPFVPEVFEKVELFVPKGKKVKGIRARLRFEQKHLIIENARTGAELKKFDYAEINGADYSHSKHPRWKAKAGITAASYLSILTMSFWPLLPLGLAAAVIGDSKSRQHWLTIKAENDYGVLRLDKNNFKLVMAAVEVKSGVKIDVIEDEE